MTTDKELLTLAAKAAGIETLIWHEEMQSFWTQYANPQYWNPLTDDGDAMRLAVKLGLNIMPYPIYTDPKHSVIVQKKAMPVPEDEDQRNFMDAIEIYETDPYAATRRAIVRAAAEIGRTM